MTDQTEQFTATDYFTSYNIVERLNAVASSLRYYLGEDSLPYLVYTPEDEKREAFKDFIQSKDHGDFVIGTFLDIIKWAEFIQKQKSIEIAIYQQDKLLTSCIQGGSKLDNDSTDEESYW